MILSSAKLDDWKIQAIRLTAFALVLPENRGEGWWESLTGEVPDEEVSLKKFGGLRAIGSFGEGKLGLEVSATKIDWVLGQSLEVEQWPEGFPVIGSFLSHRDSFVELMSRWLGGCPPVNRIAFGARLLLPTPDRDTSYHKLSSYLPFKLDPSGSRDFLYQINRPRKSRVFGGDLSINRLNKWQPIYISTKVLGSALPVSIDNHANSLELDVNTAAEYSEQLPSDILPPLFRELVELGSEIAAKGDIP